MDYLHEVIVIVPEDASVEELKNNLRRIGVGALEIKQSNLGTEIRGLAPPESIEAFRNSSGIIIIHRPLKLVEGAVVEKATTLVAPSANSPEFSPSSSITMSHNIPAPEQIMEVKIDPDTGSVETLKSTPAVIHISPEAKEKKKQQNKSIMKKPNPRHDWKKEAAKKKKQQQQKKDRKHNKQKKRKN